MKERTYRRIESLPNGTLKIILQIDGIDRMRYTAYPTKPHFSTFTLYPEKLLSPAENIPLKHEISIFKIKN